MIQAITRAVSQSEGSTRMWMVIAFIAGMVFTAVLAQTFLAGDDFFPGLKKVPMMPGTSGDHDTFTPAPVFDDGYRVDTPYYRLVHAYPGREAMTYG